MAWCEVTWYLAATESYPIGMTSGGSVVGGFIKVYWRDAVGTFFNAVYCYLYH